MASVAPTINRLNLAGVIVGVVLLAGMICFSAGLVSIPNIPVSNCSTCGVKK